MFYTTRLLLCLILSLGVASCNKTTPSNNDIETQSKKVTAMTQQVTIKVGEQGDALVKRYPDLFHIDKQPAGMNFYELDWNKPPRGVVILDHGKHSFTMEDVLGIVGFYVPDRSNEGIYSFTVKAGITEPDLISHDEARLKTHAILQRILQAGWKPLVGRGDPRISGKDQLNYIFATSSVNGLDPRYVPTFEEWVRIESRTPWSFYADHLYLTVSFTRERTLTDPEKPGAYLLNFNIRSEAEVFRAYVSPLDRPKWKELLPAELPLYPQERAKAEATLRAKGIKIDESYEDPPVPNLK
jgi:hypothetical protein